MVTPRRGWNEPVHRASEMDKPRHGEPFHPDTETPDPYIDEPKWAAWKVTLAVVVFCSAFWAGISYLAMRLLG